MTNHNLNDERADQNASEQANADAEEAYGLPETKKSVNRNFVVLLLIAVVGASMIYLMHMRGQFNANQQNAAQAKSDEAVNQFMKDSEGSIDKLEQDLARTEKQVALFQQDTTAGQIDPGDLKLNPFSFGTPAAAKSTEQAVQAPVASAMDPSDPVRNAASKAKIQMILYSTTNSSVTINNWVFRTGDRIELDAIPFTIKSIGAKSIVLSHPLGDFVVDAPGTQGM